jgi:hypothetical protein
MRGSQGLNEGSGLPRCAGTATEDALLAPPLVTQSRTPAWHSAESGQARPYPVRQMWAYAEPTTTTDTHPLNAPGEFRDGVALANRERGDHVGLERTDAIFEVAAIPDGDSGTAQGHGSVADLQVFNAKAAEH